MKVKVCFGAEEPTIVLLVYQIGYGYPENWMRSQEECIIEGI